MTTGCIKESGRLGHEARGKEKRGMANFGQTPCGHIVVRDRDEMGSKAIPPPAETKLESGRGQGDVAHRENDMMR